VVAWLTLWLPTPVPPGRLPSFTIAVANLIPAQIGWEARAATCARADKFFHLRETTSGGSA
jgi:hypothetical protein